MVKESEIKAGNYFYVKYENEEVLCAIDKALEPPYYIAKIDEKKVRIAIQPNDLKPVKLTPDWIKKFGFSRGEIADVWIRKAESLISMLRNSSTENGWTLVHSAPEKTSKPCNYVHQLQNDYLQLFGNLLIEEKN